jgi:hypothetical protein
MFRWTSIGGFHNVRKIEKVHPQLFVDPIVYAGKIKLHGTCGAVAVYPDGRVEAQSRTAVLSAKEDNANFAKQCVFANEAYWSHLAGNTIITIYGEWCGPGIQKGTAIQQIPEKVFAVFAIQLGESNPDEHDHDQAPLVIDPQIIKRMLFKGDLPDNVIVLPWYDDGNTITVKYGDAASMEAAVSALNKMVDDVEVVDPWVKDTFGVEGIGEGVVYYPVNCMAAGSIPRCMMSTLGFKAKGEKHKVTKSNKAVHVAPEVAASIEEFVDLVVTDARLEQGAREVAGGELVFDMKTVGVFLRWFNQDVLKETADELEASELTWEQVGKPVSTAARNWYLEKFKEL